jgi:hypothetical protein
VGVAENFLKKLPADQAAFNGSVMRHLVGDEHEAANVLAIPLQHLHNPVRCQGDRTLPWPE